MRLLEANCICALDTKGAHFGPFGGGAASTGTTLGGEEGAGSAAVAMGGAAGRIEKSQKK